MIIDKDFTWREKEFDSFLKTTDMTKYADHLCNAYTTIESAEHYITCALAHVYKLYPAMDYEMYADSYDNSLKITFIGGVPYDFQVPQEIINKFDKLNFSVIWWYLKVEEQPEKRIFEQYKKHEEKIEEKVEEV